MIQPIQPIQAIIPSSLHPIIPWFETLEIWNLVSLVSLVSTPHPIGPISSPSSKVTAIQPSRRISTWPLAPRRVWSVPLPPSSRWISQPAMVSWSICPFATGISQPFCWQKRNLTANKPPGRALWYADPTTSISAVLGCTHHGGRPHCVLRHVRRDACLKITKNINKTALIFWKQWIHVRKTVVNCCYLGVLKLKLDLIGAPRSPPRSPELSRKERNKHLEQVDRL